MNKIADDHTQLNYDFELIKEHLQKRLLVCFTEKCFPEKPKNV